MFEREHCLGEITVLSDLEGVDHVYVRAFIDFLALKFVGDSMGSEILYFNEHPELKAVYCNGIWNIEEVAWLVNEYYLEVTMGHKESKARQILEHLRMRGEYLGLWDIELLSDDEVYLAINKAGWLWAKNQQTWVRQESLLEESENER
jgi:hypothetical protein